MPSDKGATKELPAIKVPNSRHKTFLGGASFKSRIAIFVALSFGAISTFGGLCLYVDHRANEVFSVWEDVRGLSTRATEVVKRLNLIQTELFSHQNYKNKMTKNKIVNVLVENKIKNQNKFFGRTEYMTAVIFDGEENIEGKIVPVLITHYNQNNLFGEIKLNTNIKAA